MTYLLALDQGTSSSRAIIFDLAGNIINSAQQEFTQHYPKSGWVEHDPLDIWNTQLKTAQLALKQSQLNPKQIAAIGITNQRETTLLWDKRTGQTVHPAIVWQDRRTEQFCAQLRNDGKQDFIHQKTGLYLDPYFSATKIHWILNHNPKLKELAKQGHLAFGTVDTWLLWQLTAGKVHATDITNASRTLLFNIHQQQWDDDLLNLFEIPANILPKVQESASYFAHTESQFFNHEIPIYGIAGDQQSALFGQTCFHEGLVKNTYGTGCFMLMHTGAQAFSSQNGLITTATAQVKQQIGYALEGSVFVGGAVVQWLRDNLNAFQKSSEIENLALTVADSGGVTIVPAFTGLGAPYWQADARGTISGLSRGTTMAHLARAALESIAFQSTDLLYSMQKDAQQSQQFEIKELRADGGAAKNNLLMQFQADLLGIPVIRPTLIETTALGAAYLAGLGCGLIDNLKQLESLWQIDKVFDPKISRDEAQTRMNDWQVAIRKTQTK